MYRLLSLSLVAFLVAPVFADKVDKVDKGDKVDANQCEGVLTGVTGNKITVAEKGKKDDATLTLSKDAKITCDGKECKLTDLKKGVFLKVWTSKDDKTKATKIEADTKKSATKDSKSADKPKTDGR